MQFAQRTLLLAALFLASVSWFHGQSSGHWKGVIQIADRELTVDIDRVKNGLPGNPGTFTARLTFHPADVSN